MGTNTLTNRAAGQTILATFFNDIHQALNGDLVGRNSSGVPSTNQNLGTTALPWNVINAMSLVLNGSSVDVSQIVSPVNRIVSGKTRSTSNQPAFITPNGAAASFVLEGVSENLQLDINGSIVSVNTDISVTGLTVAPGTQNTATVNDSTAAGQDDTRRWGESDHFKKITMASAGTNITALVGKYAAFKIGTEYFIAYVESSTVLSKAMRGYFYSSTLAPFNRTTFSNGATITLMSLGWVFVENNAATVSVSYTVPVWAYVAPTSPATNDYWYDLGNNVWKRYDGASWTIINRTLVGSVVIDSTNCVAARCVDFYANTSSKNTIEVEISTTEIVQTSKINSEISVAGRMIYLGNAPSKWNITTMLATSADMYSATEAASTYYFLYIKDTGEFVISDISPYSRPELGGKYHPHNPWRAVGRIYNDGSSNITKISGYYNPTTENIQLLSYAGMGAVNTKIIRYTTTTIDNMANIEYATSANSGASFTAMEEGEYEFIARFGNTDINYCGLSRNSTQLTTSVLSITDSTRVVMSTTPYANEPVTMSALVHLKAGEVIRPHIALTGSNSISTANAMYVKQTRSFME